MQTQETKLRKPAKSTASNILFGRVPPQDLIAEEAVLGAIMLEKEKQQEVFGIILKPECFYSDAHQKIYRAALEADRIGLPVDLITVTDQARSLGILDDIGGPFVLTKLTMAVTSTAHASAHARIVMEKHMLREMIRISGDVINMAYADEDCFDLIETAEREIMGLTLGSVSKGFMTSAQYAKEALDNLGKLMQNNSDLTGVPTGYEVLNKATHGWQRTDLVIIGARPSIGKTAFALNLALNALTHGIGVGMFSLEMSGLKLTNRVLAMMSGLTLEKIKKGRNLSDQDFRLYSDTCARFAKLKFLIDDDANLSITHLKPKARRMVSKHGVEMIIVDYLQLMQGTGDKKQNREQEISTISRNLKVLAKELNVPIIALSQLNRSIESRANKEPNLSDLRESGAIEQDADVICFLYGQRQNEENVDEENLPRFVNIAKNREGSLETLELIFNTTTQRFYDENIIRHQKQVPPDNPRAGIRNYYERDDQPF